VPAHGPVPRATASGITWWLQPPGSASYPNSSGLLGEQQGWFEPGYNDSAWTPVRLPDTGRLSDGEVGWYRSTFSLHLPACTTAGISITFPGEPGTEEIYLNGVHIARAGRDTATSYVLPPGVLNVDGPNTLALARWAIDGSTVLVPSLHVDNVARTCGS
jgi:hypothetical protein